LPTAPEVEGLDGGAPDEGSTPLAEIFHID
jgi:hypothetical protein